MKEFDPKRLIERGNEILTVDAGELGIIKYGKLNMKDLLEVFGKPFTVDNPDPTPEQSLELAWRMLNKAYPDLSLEDMKLWLPKDVEKILQVLFDEEDFREPD